MVSLRLSILEPKGQTALERLSMAISHELVAGSTAFGLRALRGQQVTEARRTPDQLALGGKLEALGNGLFGLLHDGERTKTENATPLGKSFVRYFSGFSTRPQSRDRPSRAWR